MPPHAPLALAAALALSLVGAARAQAPSSTPPGDEEALRRELEAALRADRPQAPAAAVSPATAEAAGSAPPAGLLRGVQSLNPDLSAILDVAGGAATAASPWSAGDDPALPLHASGRAAGFTVQELEIALSAVADPYLKGEVYLAIPNLGGVEVEEAVLTTTSLPGSLQLRAGTFRSAFGRQNGQHLHSQEFAARPLLNAAFLGADGLRGPGAQLSWLAPLPFFLTLYAEAFSLSAPGEAGGPLPSFGGPLTGGFTGALHAKSFAALGEETSLLLGASFAAGRTPGRAEAAGLPLVAADAPVQLYGAEVTLKWKPANVAQGYRAVSWQSELVLRHRHAVAAQEAGAPLDAEWDGGLYSQLTAQLARRLFLGARLDLLGVPGSSVVPRTLRGTLTATFRPSEFARVRLQGFLERAWRQDAPGARPDLRPSFATEDRDAAGLLLQLEVSIGAHGAHAF